MNDLTVTVEEAVVINTEPPPLDAAFRHRDTIPPSHRAKLKELREKQREQMARVEELKQETKEAKAVLELTNARIGQAIDEIDQPDLFDQAAEPEGWQDVPLSEALANISETVIEALAEARLTTIGELSDWLAEPGKFNRLTDIKGIGEAKAAAIEAALEAFWVRWREAGASEDES